MNVAVGSFTRAMGGLTLKLKSASPTLLVGAGVVGFGVTAVLAARATRDLDPIMSNHHQGRKELMTGVFETKKEYNRALFSLYMDTTWDLTRLYGTTVLIGTGSAVAVLGGHRILRRRHLATVAAYSGLIDQFQAYRNRVAKTWGSDVERGIFDGAHGVWEDDPDNPGQSRLVPKYDEADSPESYLRPWFDESAPMWRNDSLANFLWLKGAQEHCNRLLYLRGHMTLNDICDELKIDRTNAGMTAGWKWNSEVGDNHIDFGFLDSMDPQAIAFRNGEATRVRLNFNIDGPISI